MRDAPVGRDEAQRAEGEWLDVEHEIPGLGDDPRVADQDGKRTFEKYGGLTDDEKALMTSGNACRLFPSFA